EYFISRDDVFIFVAGPDGLRGVYQPGIVAMLEERCANLDRHFASCSVKWERLASVREALDRTARAHLQALYAELIAPVERDLKGTVVFVPHGFLHGLPFHALHDGTRFLIENHKVAYSPSAALYCGPAPPMDVERPVFIAFSRDDHGSSVSEVEGAAAHFRDAEVLINPSQKELRSTFERARRLVHIAGHAGIDTVGGKLAWIETPAGKLTTRDLADMHIRTETLVITGCQSARRLIKPGDEWLGLMRAFYLSGASTIISALWDIRDESARRFAAEFYKLFDGSNAAAAVQQASAVVRDWRSHPYFWAGFGVFSRKQL
ncbi:MAG: CHAT domain-containing protein, partial [Acidobacteria bacterium]|nr:CHAT domain-containing protein [Acidobacteriota bacterium]